MYSFLKPHFFKKIQAKSLLSYTFSKKPDKLFPNKPMSPTFNITNFKASLFRTYADTFGIIF